MAILILMAAGAIRAAYNAITGKRPAADTICPHCGTRANPKQITRGSLLIEIVLWLCFLIPGLIYSIWRLTTRYTACPACGAAGMIPVDTPHGKRLLEQNRQP